MAWSMPLPPMHPRDSRPAGDRCDVTLRDQFAAAALTGLLASDQYDRLVTAADYADAAYEMADAMLAAREAK